MRFKVCLRWLEYGTNDIKMAVEKTCVITSEVENIPNT